jgi:outer membrane protein assembly factor BamE (lipoprotein component of BamABCDE complex)
MPVLFAVLIALGGPGCFSRTERGAVVRDAAVSALQLGTSREDAMRDLGAPSSMASLADREIWFYEFSVNTGAALFPLVLMGSDRARMLRLEFDTAGKLARIDWLS